MHRHAEDLRLVVRFVAAGIRTCGLSLICRFRPQRIVHAFKFHTIARRIQIRNIRLHPVVDENRSADFHSRIRCNRAVGANSAGYYHQIRRNHSTVFKIDLSVFKLLCRSARQNADAVCLKDLLKHMRCGGIQFI